MLISQRSGVAGAHLNWAEVNWPRAPKAKHNSTQRQMNQSLHYESDSRQR